jgi:hypothetical protein
MVFTPDKKTRDHSGKQVAGGKTVAPAAKNGTPGPARRIK